MAAIITTVPQFRKGERVAFIGGAGVVKNYRPDSGGWSYNVEMDMGPEPDVGRIGYETTIVLCEADLAPCAEEIYSTLAIA